MSTCVCVLSNSGERLMPTFRLGRVRRLLKDGKAKIVKHHPFTIQLLYSSKTNTQPIEICEDVGYNYIGISVKSQSHEYVSTFNKHTTVTLELSNAAMDWDGTDFRCVFTYKSTGHTMSTDTTTANDIAQARTGHLIIYAPPIEMTPLKAQSLLLNNYDSSNGNLAWTTPASNPNNGRSPKEIPLDETQFNSIVSTVLRPLSIILQRSEFC